MPHILIGVYVVVGYFTLGALTGLMYCLHHKNQSVGFHRSDEFYAQLFMGVALVWPLVWVQILRGELP